MNREQIIKSFFENMEEMGRAAFSHAPESHAKGMPTRAQIGIMFALSHYGKQSIKQLAQVFHMSSSAVTQLVNGLVKEKLIARAEDAEDRRKICVELTALGKKKMVELSKLRAAKFRSALQPLTDVELLQFQKIIAKIVQHLKTTWKKHPHN